MTEANQAFELYIGGKTLHTHYDIMIVLVTTVITRTIISLWHCSNHTNYAQLIQEAQVSLEGRSQSWLPSSVGRLGILRPDQYLQS